MSDADSDADSDVDVDDEVRSGYAAREAERRWLDDEYNRNRFALEDDDRVGRVWGGEDEFDSQPTGATGVIGTEGTRYVPGRARMGRDG
jgi:hypothetical protein